MRPDFSNVAFQALRDALGKVADYVEELGVNPSGSPGWSWAPGKGWRPPFANLINPIAAPWDVTPGETAGTVVLNPGLIRPLYSTQPTNVTITDVDDEQTPVADTVTYLRADFTPAGQGSVTSVTLVTAASWTDFPEIHDFDTSTPKKIEKVYWPLWGWLSPTKEKETDLTWIDYHASLGRKLYALSETVTGFKVIDDHLEWRVEWSGAKLSDGMAMHPVLVPTGFAQLGGIT